jgi:hypothetical protein
MPYVNEQNLADVVLERWKDVPNPRLKQIMQSLIKHLHGEPVSGQRRAQLLVAVGTLPPSRCALRRTPSPP